MSNFFLNQLQHAHENDTFALFIKESARSGELFKEIPALKDLNQIPQDPRWHPEGDVWTHTLLVIDNLPANATFAMALCALFHDVGKATATVIHETGRITAHGHEKDSKKLTSEILINLGADSKLIEDVLFLVYRHMIAHSKEANIKTLHRLVLEVGAELVDQLLLHGVADVKGGFGDLTDCIRLRELFDNMGKSKIFHKTIKSNTNNPKQMKENCSFSLK